jgi:hypothetical protein
MKLASTFNPAFEPREATSGVGFFMTKRAATSRIERRSKPSGVDGLADVGPVHYFVKSVPKEYQASFASAFDEWNEKFGKLMGHKIFSYEFVAADDPKAKLIVAGDPRFNVLEWDLNNKAPYGGLGPSEANQFTGEIFSANVLIQGPTVVDIYTKWFKTTQKVNRLLLAGRDWEAEEALRDGTVALREELKSEEVPRFDLRLGEGEDLVFRVTAQTPPLQDPAMQRIDFETIPGGYDYAKYMDGYFHEMVTHELGHNLGLRHNFRGNLGAALDPSTGGVSDSIMEYLGRSFRYVNRVGAYDMMAISYGYLGTPPKRTDLYCTDEDVPKLSNLLLGSAECSPNDATTDPFRYFEGVLATAVDKLVARGTSEAPVWSVDDMSSEVTTALSGMILYPATVDLTGMTWTAFFTGGDRPSSPLDVRDYVLKRLKSHLCDPTIAAVLTAKKDDAVRGKVKDNMTALAKLATKVAGAYDVYTEKALACP